MIIYMEATLMCGRYLLEDEAYADILEILSGIDKASGTAQHFASGEIFPTSIVPVITRTNEDAANANLIGCKWGFPHWKNSSVIINARAETAFEKSMFSKSLMERRCVVPSSGFFEWSRAGRGKKKDKYLLREPGERVLYMAGMIKSFNEPSGAQYSAFVILTTAANESVAPIHDRMPVILAPDELDQWIGDISFVDYALQRIGPELVHQNQ